MLQEDTAGDSVAPTLQKSEQPLRRLSREFHVIRSLIVALCLLSLARPTEAQTTDAGFGDALSLSMASVIQAHLAVCVVT